jgi:hypothetical protein
MCEAVGDQTYHERSEGEADLTDILVVSIVLGGVLHLPAPCEIDRQGIASFNKIGLSDKDCTDILAHAQEQLGSLQDALGC